MSSGAPQWDKEVTLQGEGLTVSWLFQLTPRSISVDLEEPEPEKFETNPQAIFDMEAKKWCIRSLRSAVDVKKKDETDAKVKSAGEVAKFLKDNKDREDQIYCRRNSQTKTFRIYSLTIAKKNTEKEKDAAGGKEASKIPKTEVSNMEGNSKKAALTETTTNLYQPTSGDDSVPFPGSGSWPDRLPPHHPHPKKNELIWRLAFTKATDDQLIATLNKEIIPSMSLERGRPVRFIALQLRDAQQADYCAEVALRLCGKLAKVGELQQALAKVIELLPRIEVPPEEGQEQEKKKKKAFPGGVVAAPVSGGKRIIAEIEHRFRNCRFSCWADGVKFPFDWKRNTYVRQDDEAGVYISDCSGFFRSVVETAGFQRAYHQIGITSNVGAPGNLTITRAFAQALHGKTAKGKPFPWRSNGDSIQDKKEKTAGGSGTDSYSPLPTNGSHWQRILRPQDLQPGDVINYAKHVTIVTTPDDFLQEQCPHNRFDEAPAADGWYTVRVAHCTGGKLLHHQRPNPGNISGLATGIMRFRLYSPEEAQTAWDQLMAAEKEKGDQVMEKWLMEDMQGKAPLEGAFGLSYAAKPNLDTAHFALAARPLWSDEPAAHGDFDSETQLESGGVYEIEPHHAPGLRIDVHNSGSANGTKIQLGESTTGDSQKFKVVEVHSGHYVFEPLVAPGKAIDGRGAQPGRPCHVWDTFKNTNENSHFRLDLVSAASTGGGKGDKGYFAVITRSLGGAHCWEVEEGKTNKGARIRTAECVEDAKAVEAEHRQFKFIKVEPSSEKK